MATVRKLARQLAWDAGLDPDEAAKLPHAIDDFGGFGGEPDEYKQAPDLTRIATALIAAHPGRLGHLRQFAVLLLWARTLGASRGTLKWWAVAVPRKLLAWVLGRDERPDVAAAQAVLLLSLAACREAKPSWWELEALVYAALRTIEDNDAGGVRVVPFGEALEAEVAARYGAWSPRLKRLGEALLDGEAYQQRLDLEAEERQRQAVAAAEERVKTTVRAGLEAAGVL